MHAEVLSSTRGRAAGYRVHDPFRHGFVGRKPFAPVAMPAHSLLLQCMEGGKCELLQADLGVFHWCEGWRPGDPGDRVFPPVQQVDDDLSSGLAGADDGDVLGSGERVASLQVVGAVEDVRADHVPQAGRYHRLGAEWTHCTRQGSPYNISVARKASVALMDLHVGPTY